MKQLELFDSDSDQELVAIQRYLRAWNVAQASHKKALSGEGQGKTAEAAGGEAYSREVAVCQRHAQSLRYPADSSSSASDALRSETDTLPPVSRSIARTR